MRNLCVPGAYVCVDGEIELEVLVARKLSMTFDMYVQNVFIAIFFMFLFASKEVFNLQRG